MANMTFTCDGDMLSRICAMALLAEPYATTRLSAEETQSISWLLQLCDADTQTELVDKDAARFVSTLRVLSKLRLDPGILANRVLFDQSTQTLLSAWAEAVEDHFQPLIRPRFK